VSLVYGTHATDLAIPINITETSAWVWVWSYTSSRSSHCSKHLSRKIKLGKEVT